MSYLELFLLAAGILWGMFYYSRTGWACGGIITPGLMAISAGNLPAIGYSLIAGTGIAIVLDLLVRGYALYGRQRIAVAMVLAIAIRMATLGLFPYANLWVGWVVPALIASDMQKQGFLRTLSGVVSVTLVTLMTLETLRYFVMIL
jgi:hypothetical protein